MKSIFLSYIVQIILSIVFKTSKIKVHGEQYLKHSRDSAFPTMVCSWHSRFFYAIYFLQKNNYNVWALSSTHKDSEVLAKVLKRWNVNLIRGSSTRGWKNIIVQMKEKLQDSNTMIALTNDGPKGPSKIAKPGSVKLALKYNAEIITMTATSSKFFEFKTWDKLRIPKPFSTIDIHISSPLLIDENKINNLGDVEYLSDFMNEFEQNVDQEYTNG